jgi:hypothetical protein
MYRIRPQEQPPEKSRGVIVGGPGSTETMNVRAAMIWLAVLVGGKEKRNERRSTRLVGRGKAVYVGASKTTMGRRSSKTALLGPTRSLHTTDYVCDFGYLDCHRDRGSWGDRRCRLSQTGQSRHQRPGCRSRRRKGTQVGGRAQVVLWRGRPLCAYRCLARGGCGFHDQHCCSTLGTP